MKGCTRANALYADWWWVKGSNLRCLPHGWRIYSALTSPLVITHLEENCGRCEGLEPSELDSLNLVVIQFWFAVCPQERERWTAESNGLNPLIAVSPPEETSHLYYTGEPPHIQTANALDNPVGLRWR